MSSLPRTLAGSSRAVFALTYAAADRYVGHVVSCWRVKPAEAMPARAAEFATRSERCRTSIGE